VAAVKWGVLGTANIARGCTIPGMKLAEDCELYAIAGRSLEKAESFKEDFYRSINMPTNLRELGVEPTDEELALMAKKCAVGVGGEMGSAKVLNEEAMLAIYRASM
jgi:alcohol dehydrogenase YqhD (iron-dependent ADH family)